MQELYLSTAYLAPIEYYAHICKRKKAYIESCENYIKQTYRNRCCIYTANGIQQLSIPVEKPHNEKCLIKDLLISQHGNWQHVHWNAISSAYNNTPFFEYYKDDFIEFYNKPYKYLLDFNQTITEMICKLIDIDTEFIYTTDYIHQLDKNTLDLRMEISPKRKEGEYSLGFTQKKYYQVFEHKYGFIENLSIIDLLFNMGNESLIILTDSIR